MSERARALHASPWMGVFHITGGGVSLLTELLGTPGASRTVLDASVPYAGEALALLLGRAPEQACSGVTARQIAVAALEHARHLRSAAGTTQPLQHTFGFGCTASLATDREKKGTHRAHWAIQTETDTFSFAATYDGTRQTEETQLVEQIWTTLLHCLIDPRIQIDEDLTEIHATSTAPLRRLLEPEPYRHCLGRDDGRLLLPGSFNPVHAGHREMLSIAEELTGLSGAFELSVRNADKPSLDFVSINERSAAIGDTPLWLTNTPNFEGKARLFPDVTFALGVDTVTRIGEVRFYEDSQQNLQRALRSFQELNIRFIVFGREIDGNFITLEDVELPPALAERCRGVPESVYRNDQSSTRIRRQRSR